MPELAITIGPVDSARRRILIACGSEAQGRRLQALLDEAGYETAIAADGQEVLDNLAAQRPDAIALESSLSDSDGLEICRRIKSDATIRNVAVLVIVSLNNIDELEHVVDAGADDFISAPVLAAELLKRVDNLLRYRL